MGQRCHNARPMAQALPKEDRSPPPTGDSGLERTQLLEFARLPVGRLTQAVMGVMGDAADRGLLAPCPPATEVPHLTADLRFLGVPALLQTLLAGGHTGALVVADQDGERAVFLDDGQLTGCTSTHRADRLGEVLWRQGRLSLDQLLIASASMRPGVKLGRLLIELGYLAASDLYRALRAQAQAGFEETCLCRDGMAIFLPNVRLRNPLSMDQAQDSLEHAVSAQAECKALEEELGSQDLPILPAAAQPAGRVTEGEAALLQLSASSTPPLTARALLERVGLGRLEGLRALARLVRDGFLEAFAPPGEVIMVPDEGRALESQCEALNLVMGALRTAGFGALDGVMAMVHAPPEHLRDVYEVLAIAPSGVDAGHVRSGEANLDDGLERVGEALKELLDFALFEARDMLDDATVADLTAQLEALGMAA